MASSFNYFVSHPCPQQLLHPSLTSSQGFGDNANKARLVPKGCNLRVDQTVNEQNNTIVAIMFLCLTRAASPAQLSHLETRPLPWQRAILNRLAETSSCVDFTRLAVTVGLCRPPSYGLTAMCHVYGDIFLQSPRVAQNKQSNVPLFGPIALLPHCRETLWKSLQRLSPRPVPAASGGQCLCEAGSGGRCGVSTSFNLTTQCTCHVCRWPEFVCEPSS